MKSLDNILSGSEAAPATEQDTTPAATEQAAEQITEQTTDADGSHTAQGSTAADGKPVPVGAIRQAEREKADKRYTAVLDNLRTEIAERDAAWERRVANLTAAVKPPPPPQEAPDFWEKPPEYIQQKIEQQTQPLHQAMQQQREQFSHMMAAEKFGSDVVSTAYAELESRIKQNPQAAQADYVRIMRSPHPYAELVKWHQGQQAMAEIGPDPVAYKAKVEAEVRAKLEAETQPDALTQPRQNGAATVMPSNFATARNVGSRSGPAWSGPQPIADIFARSRSK